MGGRGAAWPASHHRKMARLHTIIMVGGGLWRSWMGYPDAARRAEKQDAAASSPRIELAQGGRSFLRAAEPICRILKRLSILVPFFSLFVGDNVGAAARAGAFFALITTETLATVYRSRQPVRAAENAPRLSASGEMD